MIRKKDINQESFIKVIVISLLVMFILTSCTSLEESIFTKVGEQMEKPEKVNDAKDSSLEIEQPFFETVMEKTVEDSQLQVKDEEPLEDTSSPSSENVVEGMLEGETENNFKSSNEAEEIVEEENEKQQDFIAPNLSLYDVIRKGLMDVENEINVSMYPEKSSSNKIFDIVRKVVDENPEILYYSGSKYWSNGVLYFEYRKDRETILEHRGILENKKKEIIDAIIKPDMTNYEKEKAVHDYIINHATYDTRGNIPFESYTAYGVLVKGTGVCEGYARAMKLIMDDLGIECYFVTGDGKSQPHAWNIVKLGGDYYHVDLTWDDPLMKNDSAVLRYDYFNVDDRTMTKDHTWNQKNFPKSTGTQYNYFEYNGLVVGSYDGFYNKIKDSMMSNKNEISLKILNYDNTLYNISNTIDEILAEVRDINIKGYSYRTNDDLGIVTINFIK